jgi:hypothetical protein
MQRVKEEGVDPGSRHGQGPGGSGGRSMAHEAGEARGEADGWAGRGVGSALQRGKERGSEWQVGPDDGLMNSKQSKSIFKCVQLDLIQIAPYRAHKF